MREQESRRLSPYSWCLCQPLLRFLLNPSHHCCSSTHISSVLNPQLSVQSSICSVKFSPNLHGFLRLFTLREMRERKQQSGQKSSAKHRWYPDCSFSLPVSVCGTVDVVDLCEKNFQCAQRIHPKENFHLIFNNQFIKQIRETNVDIQICAYGFICIKIYLCFYKKKQNGRPERLWNYTAVCF